jgi:cell division protein FtsZ
MVEERVAVAPAASVTDPPAAAPDPGPEPAEDARFVAATSGTDSGDRAGEDAEPVAAAAVPARHRADPGAAARMFDAATTTRRRSVVFEEDDELDVPDFLK